MKKVILGLILGLVISGISVLAYSIASNEVSYTPNNKNWNVDNVESAINDLYDAKSQEDLYIIFRSETYDKKESQAMIYLTNFIDKYKYFKIEKNEFKTSDTSTCNLKSWTSITQGLVDINLNQEYEYNRDDLKLVSVYSLVTGKTTNKYAGCEVTIHFYNK